MKTYGSVVEIGRVTGAHGLRGEVRVRWFGDGPETLLSLDEVRLGSSLEDPRPRLYRVHRAGTGRAGEVRLALEGVNDRDAAGALRGAPPARVAEVLIARGETRDVPRGRGGEVCGRAGREARRECELAGWVCAGGRWRRRVTAGLNDTTQQRANDYDVGCSSECRVGQRQRQRRDAHGIYPDFRSPCWLRA